MTADKQLKAYIDRVLRLKEEQDTIGDDIREIYAEAKAEGYDKTIMGKVVAHLRRELKKGSGAVDEAEMVFDTYLTAYRRASGTPVATHTHEEEFDPITGEFTTKSPRKAAEAVSERTAVQVEDHSSAEATIEGQPSETVATSAESAGEAASSDLPTNSEIDPTEDRSEGQSLDGGLNAVDANTGGSDVDGSAVRADTSNTAGGTVSNPPAKPLRPHCLRPENCGGYGSNHCFSCKRAAKANDEEEAA